MQIEKIMEGEKKKDAENCHVEESLVKTLTPLTALVCHAEHAEVSLTIYDTYCADGSNNYIILFSTY